MGKSVVFSKTGGDCVVKELMETGNHLPLLFSVSL